MGFCVYRGSSLFTLVPRTSSARLILPGVPQHAGSGTAGTAADCSP